MVKVVETNAVDIHEVYYDERHRGNGFVKVIVEVEKYGIPRYEEITRGNGTIFELHRLKRLSSISDYYMALGNIKINEGVELKEGDIFRREEGNIISILEGKIREEDYRYEVKQEDRVEDEDIKGKKVYKEIKDWIEDEYGHKSKK